MKEMYKRIDKKKELNVKVDSGGMHKAKLDEVYTAQGVKREDSGESAHEAKLHNDRQSLSLTHRCR